MAAELPRSVQCTCEQTLVGLVIMLQTNTLPNYVGSAVIRFIFEMYKGNVGIESFRNLLAVGIELDILPIPF